jgi:hypothetical protein
MRKHAAVLVLVVALAGIAAGSATAVLDSAQTVPTPVPPQSTKRPD